MEKKETADSFIKLYDIIKKLRSPEGCPWDKEQSPETLRSDLLEEAYEVIEAINEKDDAHLEEELGDLFLLATMISYMKEQENSFSVKSTLDGISEKLIRRHPHVFGNAKGGSSDDILKQWEDIKVNIEGRKAKTSLLDKVSKGLPPLERAYKLQKKAAKVGFDWPDLTGVWDKVYEEIEEVKEVDPQDKEHLQEELGDLLFSIINVSRFMGIDPAEALYQCNQKFMNRFAYIEQQMNQNGVKMSSESFKLMDKLWDEAKTKQ